MEKNALKALREELGCSQEELATILGVSKATISRYETDNQMPKGDSAKKVQQLQCLLAGEDKMKTLNLLKEGGAGALAGLLAFGAASHLGAGVTLLGLCTLPGVAAVGALAAGFGLLSKKLK